MKLVCLLMLLAGAAQAQTTTVWRCGPASYSASPCPQGRAVVIDAAPNAAEVRAARDVAARDAALARRLEQQRLDSAGIAPSGLAGLKPAPGVRPKMKKRPKTPAKPGTSPAALLPTPRSSG